LRCGANLLAMRRMLVIVHNLRFKLKLFWIFSLLVILYLTSLPFINAFLFYYFLCINYRIIYLFMSYYRYCGGLIYIPLFIFGSDSLLFIC
jgi:hypothetical protein